MCENVDIKVKLSCYKMIGNDSNYPLLGKDTTEAIERINGLEKENERLGCDVDHLTRERDAWQSKSNRQKRDIQRQAAKIAELVKHIESGDECHVGMTARKCHCEEKK